MDRKDSEMPTACCQDHSVDLNLLVIFQGQGLHLGSQMLIASICLFSGSLEGISYLGYREAYSPKSYFILQNINSVHIIHNFHSLHIFYNGHNVHNVHKAESYVYIM